MQHRGAEQRLREAGDAAGAGCPRARAACGGAVGRRSHPRRRRTPRRGAPARGSPIRPSSKERGRSPHRGELSRPRAGARRRPRSASRRSRARRTRRGARRRGRARSRTAPAASALARRSRAGRSRRALTGRGSSRANPVPDDRVAALVEPVVRRGDVGAPGRRAGVLHLCSRRRQRSGAGRLERPRAPACDERAGHGASLFRPCPGARPRVRHWV